MVLEINHTAILRKANRDEVLRILVKYATQLALLGEVDTARALITLRNQKSVRTPDERGLGPLDWAWRVTGQWPEGVADTPKTDERFSKMRAEYESGNWARIPDENRSFDETGLEECLSSDREDSSFADATSGYDAMLKGQRLVKALDISVRLMRDESKGQYRYGETAEEQSRKESFNEGIDKYGRINAAPIDKRSADIAKQLVSRWHANCQMRYLMEAETLWPLYINGVLARAMGLSKAEMEEKKSEINRTFSTRLSRGHLPPLCAGKSIEELLDIGERNTWHAHLDDEELQLDTDLSSWTMFHPRASDDEISSLESRLSITLPADYKEFLRITNGFGTGGQGIFTGILPDPEIWDVSRVEWIRDRQQPAEFLEIPREIEEFGDFRTRYGDGDDSLGWDTPCPLFDRMLQIGNDDDLEGMYLVPPETVEKVKAAYEVMLAGADEQGKAVVLDAMDRLAGSKEAFDKMEWGCCTIGDCAEMSGYSSFRSYLEHATSKVFENC